ncbi:hypothetical protein RRG08_031058 [Elysia crispata]|uniref:Uncharacterized protein n=1 Tax=Elysia crispata TaxID=231223 RepID=A0AAE0ZFJ6_9GAST|nr:hypothetical protein RRG08_031058 [Elysia crispata]
MTNSLRLPVFTSQVGSSDWICMWRRITKAKTPTGSQSLSGHCHILTSGPSRPPIALNQTTVNIFITSGRSNCCTAAVNMAEQDSFMARLASTVYGRFRKYKCWQLDVNDQRTIDNHDVLNFKLNTSTTSTTAKLIRRNETTFQLEVKITRLQWRSEHRVFPDKTQASRSSGAGRMREIGKGPCPAS